MLATRTRTVSLAISAGCYVSNTRPSARPSTISPCPPRAPATVLCGRAARPWPPRPFTRLHDCVHPPLHLLAVLATHTRTVSLAVSAGCYVSQHAHVRPSLHLLAVPAPRTCHLPLRPCHPSLATRATCPVTRLRPPAPPPSCSARHPHSHHSLSPVCDP